MQRVFTIQPRMRPDMQLPYPFFVREDGRVERQDFWRGKVFRVIGFQASLNKMTVDLFWHDAVRNPEKATGMYVVLADDKNAWSTETSPTEPLTFEELPECYEVEGTDVNGQTVHGSAGSLDAAKADFKRLGGVLSGGYEIRYTLGHFDTEVKTVKARKARA